MGSGPTIYSIIAPDSTTERGYYYCKEGKAPSSPLGEKDRQAHPGQGPQQGDVKAARRRGCIHVMQEWP